jgi:hypothetical protein
LTAPTPYPRRYRRAAILSGVLIVVIVMAAAGLAQRGAGPTPTVIPTATPPIPHDLAPDAVTDRAFPSLTYGIHAFLWWNPAMRALDLDNISLMAFSHIKQRFTWENMEPLPGEWTWTEADGVVDEIERRGMDVIARLDGPPDWAVRKPAHPTDPPVDLAAWGEFCGTLAARYKGRIAGYQVWNEPNLNREWLGYPPNAAGYVTLLETCAQAIRASDPDAVIISAGLAPTGTQLPDALPDVDYLRMMYAAGASPWFDVLGLNAPGYGNPPTMSPDEAESAGFLRWMCFRHVEDMRAIMVQEGDAHKQVALLEVGWTTDPRQDSTYHWQAVTEEQQADYLVGAYQYAAEHWRPWVGLMVTIYIADLEWTPDDEEYWWAINQAGYGWGWKGRPAYFQLSWMARYIDDQYIPPRDPGAPEVTTVRPQTPREKERFYALLQFLSQFADLVGMLIRW